MKTVLHFIAALILLILGWFTYSFFFDFSIEQLKPNQVVFQSTNLTGQFTGRLYFALLLASFPLFGLVIQSLLKLKDSTQIVLLYLLMVASAVLFWLVRISKIKKEMASMEEYLLGTDIGSSMSIENLNFVSYMAFGSLLAALIFFAIKKIFATKTENFEN
ncbi:MAG: hypothetical protein ACJA0U_003587 [Salibacteraceae bacterium]|jgi:hypothetical protein